MDPAWMVRSSQRQMFLESLRHRIMEVEDKKEDRVDYDLAKVCVAFLEFKSIAIPPPSDIHPDVWDLFRDRILPAIEKFARAEEERNALVCDLLKWLTESVSRDAYASLIRKEIADPRTIFHAASAADEI